MRSFSFPPTNSFRFSPTLHGYDEQTSRANGPGAAHLSSPGITPLFWQRRRDATGSNAGLSTAAAAARVTGLCVHRKTWSSTEMEAKPANKFLWLHASNNLRASKEIPVKTMFNQKKVSVEFMCKRVKEDKRIKAEISTKVGQPWKDESKTVHDAFSQLVQVLQKRNNTVDERSFNLQQQQRNWDWIPQHHESKT